MLNERTVFPQLLSPMTTILNEENEGLAAGVPSIVGLVDRLVLVPQPIPSTHRRSKTANDNHDS